MRGLDYISMYDYEIGIMGIWGLIGIDPLLQWPGKTMNRYVHDLILFSIPRSWWQKLMLGERRHQVGAEHKL